MINDDHKKLKDNTQFRFNKKDVFNEAYMRCMREMYAKAQPAADYDEIVKYYRECQAHHLVPDRIYKHHYLSQEEYQYIRQKYIEAYGFKDEFKDHCDIIIRDLVDGCSKDKYIAEHTDKLGNWHPAHSGYEKVPPLKQQINPDIAQYVIDFIKQRRDYYRFDTEETNFLASLSFNDSPTTNADEVIKYWKGIGVDIQIDPRHYTNDDFWDEDNGYLSEEDETGI